ncbi:dihydrolipoamide acetyltransferase family protein [Parafrigoribacterium soli]|uniref:dihydrolipoamide acetyltransferase family protein n=1 Tax=Parafrigoribacterium soli TaxID=3144663 RepID=UPI0032EC9E82
MASLDFALPDLGEGLTESELVSWRVTAGDAVELNQIIAEVETAKALVELPSPFAGTITRLHVDAGSTVEVGSCIATFEVDDEAAVAESAPVAEPTSVAELVEAGGPPTGLGTEAARVEREPVLVGYGPPVEGGARPKRRPRTFLDDTPDAAPRPTGQAATQPRSTPPVRKLARDLGIELTDLVGTGDGGLITRDDVERAAACGSSGPQPAASDRPRETRTPIRGVRKHTAAAMVSSAFTAPHVSEFLTIDVTPTMELIAKLQQSREFSGLRVNLLTVVAKALCIAVSRTPSVNSRWDESAQEIVEFGYVNLGIAAATPRGLVVPNIKDADRLSLAQLAEALSGLVETARAGKASPADLGGGTISITNIGVFGIDAGTPILNPGEAMILAMGAVRRMPWEFRGEIALRQVLTLSVSFDHRLVDGEQGSRFLADVGAILSDPGMLLTMV